MYISVAIITHTVAGHRTRGGIDSGKLFILFSLPAVFANLWTNTAPAVSLHVHVMPRPPIPSRPRHGSKRSHETYRPNPHRSGSVSQAVCECRGRVRASTQYGYFPTTGFPRTAAAVRRVERLSGGDSLAPQKTIYRFLVRRKAN